MDSLEACALEAQVDLFTDLVAVLGAGTFLVRGLDGFA